MQTNEMGLAAQSLGLSGQRFGSLTYVRPVDTRDRAVIWVCVCDCGRVTKVCSRDRYQTRTCGKQCPTQSNKSFAHISGRILCEKHGETKARKKGTAYQCSRCVSETVKKRADKIKQQSVDFLGGCCSKCGYDKCLAALDFHHRDPTQKDFNISSQVRGWAKVKSELEKCDLLCANCHREYHYNKGVEDE